MADLQTLKNKTDAATETFVDASYLAKDKKSGDWRIIPWVKCSGLGRKCTGMSPATVAKILEHADELLAAGLAAVESSENPEVLKQAIAEEEAKNAPPQPAAQPAQTEPAQTAGLSGNQSALLARMRGKQ